MEKENKKKIMKIFYQNKSVRNALIVSVLIAIFFASLGNILKSRKLPQAQNIESVEEEEVYSQAKIYAITDYFATYNVDNSIKDKYYFALGDNCIYILNLSDDEYEKLSEKANSEENIDGVVVYGMSENISDDLKQYAIESMNEIYETDEINKENFGDYFAFYLVNTKRSPNDDADIFNSIAMIAVFFAILFGIIYIFSIINAKSKIKKIGEKYDLSQIVLELSSQFKKEFKRTKTIFLDNFIISYASTFEIINYTDIAWIYPHTNRVNGVKSDILIMVVTKDGKTHSIASCSAHGKENIEEYDNTYNELIKRRPYALNGYTNQNILAMSKENIENTVAKLNEKDGK